MAHPVPMHKLPKGLVGLASGRYLANYKVRVEYFGRTAQPALSPWDGINALDAAVLAYNNISVLRQQLGPEDKVHGVIEDGGTVPNVISDYSKLNFYLRSSTMKSLDVLQRRVVNCFEAAAIASECKVKYEWYVTLIGVIRSFF